MSDTVCAECSEPAQLKCSACKLVAYCGKDHQKKHWKVHKTLCRPFEIAEDAEIGKCLVATRDIRPGDIILAELPVVYGPRPHMVEEGPVPCPGCCRLIIGEQSARCEGCDFPICNPECPGLNDMDKHGHECKILGLRDVRAINGLHEFYRQDALLALRCLLLQSRHPKKFAQLMEMESHMGFRGEDTEVYKDVDSRVVSYLNDNFFAPLNILEGKSGKKVLQDISRETIHKICGIIDVNALEINQDAEVSALYPTAYLLEHSCVPNSMHIFENEPSGYKITVKAAVPIQSGEHITTMYTHCLWGTQARREHLKETKYFSCKCKRCCDPTELGSYLSALRCIGTDEEPCGGTQLPIDPLDDKTEWACDKCDVKLTNAEVCFLVNGIGEEVDNVQLANPTVRELDSLLNKMLTFLHPNHYHVYAVKHSLIQLYGYQQGYLPNQITDDCLVKKAVMCRELLDITRKVDPGNARLPLYLGVILHELYLANWVLIKRKWDLGIKTKVKSVVTMLQECQRSLGQAKEALKNEVNTPAGEKLLNLVATSAKEFEKFVERNKIDLSVKEKVKENGVENGDVNGNGN
uniref:Protein msta, isoform B n=1 Tax=Anoplophora glabripennis TaxID=217634 RepID=V5G4W8_ANOGL